MYFPVYSTSSCLYFCVGHNVAFKGNFKSVLLPQTALISSVYYYLRFHGLSTGHHLISECFPSACICQRLDKIFTSVSSRVLPTNKCWSLLVQTCGQCHPSIVLSLPMNNTLPQRRGTHHLPNARMCGRSDESFSTTMGSVRLDAARNISEPYTYLPAALFVTFPCCMNVR